jgi:hypothetical protein
MKSIVLLLFPLIGLHAAEYPFGMMGLAPADTARLTAFCSDEAPADPCDVAFHFHDPRGQIIKQSTLNLQPGFTGFLDIRASEIAGGAGRVSIIPCFLVGRGHVIGAVRISDIFTQRQRLLANMADRNQARGGELHFGVSGFTVLDTARINATCDGDIRDGCEVTLKFHLSGGVVVKQATMTLAPGSSAFLDLRFSESGIGLRTGEIIPCVLVGRGAVFTTYEMIDTLSGFTTQLAYPSAALVP